MGPQAPKKSLFVCWASTCYSCGVVRRGFAAPHHTTLFCGGGVAAPAPPLCTVYLLTTEKGDSGEAQPPQTPPLRKNLLLSVAGRYTLNGDSTIGLEKVSGSSDTLRCLGPKGGVSSIRRSHFARISTVLQGGSLAKAISASIAASGSAIAVRSARSPSVPEAARSSFADGQMSR